MTTPSTSRPDRHSHSYGVGNPLAERRTWQVMWLTAAMMIVEIVAGSLFGSMALLADGWHMSSHTFALGIAAGALTGAVIGFLTFRSGLRGSYFALVTLAFAEVLRIIASVAPITGAGVGTLIKLDLRPEALQFQSRAAFYWLLLALVAVSLLIVQAIAQSRFGAWLVAVRENEEAASALGVDTTAVKLAAMTVSAAITAAGGCFYAQYFLFVDAGIAYGPWISVEALLTPIIGGVGTVCGPLLGALVVKSLGELAKLVAGDAPGLDLVIYGVVLILVVGFAPRGIAGIFADLRRRLAGTSGRSRD